MARIMFALCVLVLAPWKAVGQTAPQHDLVQELLTFPAPPPKSDESRKRGRLASVGTPRRLTMRHWKSWDCTGATSAILQKCLHPRRRANVLSKPASRNQNLPPPS